MKNFFTVILAIIFVFLVAVAGFFFIQGSNDGVSSQIVCTQEAKLCPDGSYVERTGPNCEFAACGSATTTVATDTQATITKTFVDVSNKISFDYLDNFYMNGNLTEYVHPVEWPPQISVSATTTACPKTDKIIINGKNYCLTMLSEGAAGSTYTTYTYKLPVAKKIVTLTFIVRTPQCLNYDEPKATDCKNEEKNFDINTMVDKIFSSIKWIQ